MPRFPPPSSSVAIAVPGKMRSKNWGSGACDGPIQGMGAGNTKRAPHVGPAPLPPGGTADIRSTASNSRPGDGPREVPNASASSSRPSEARPSPERAKAVHDTRAKPHGPNFARVKAIVRGLELDVIATEELASSLAETDDVVAALQALPEEEVCCCSLS